MQTGKLTSTENCTRKTIQKQICKVTSKN